MGSIVEILLYIRQNKIPAWNGGARKLNGLREETNPRAFR